LFCDLLCGFVCDCAMQNKISSRWRTAMAAADGDAVAAYNVTLNTLAGQGEPAEIFRALNISKATTAWPLSQEAACADYLAVNGQTLQQFEAQKAQRKKKKAD
jgi:hypothetical protein